MNDGDRTNADDRLEKIAAALSIGGIERHIFLCAQPAIPRCATSEQGAESWRTLKNALKARALTSAPPPWRGGAADEPAPAAAAGNGRILRSKVDCLRVCEQGPIAVVYPDGIWYHSVSAAVIERIVEEHLIGGNVVEEFVFARDPLIRDLGEQA